MIEDCILTWNLYKSDSDFAFQIVRKMTETIVYKDRQDRTTTEWQLLLQYIDHVAETKQAEFNPARELGRDVWKVITVLPNEIEKLVDVKHLMLYNSSLERIPPTIGSMRSLEEFTPYTSDRLRWFPYEITKCSGLKNSTISTRRLYGNFKLRTPFPDLRKQRVEFEGCPTKCGICGALQGMEPFEQFWLSLRIGTDVVPLLISVCSEICYAAIPGAAENYIATPHKGGIGLKQPPRRM